MQSPPLNQPLNLQLDPCIDQGPKMPTRVLERQRIGKDEILGDLVVQLGREGHEADGCFALFHVVMILSHLYLLHLILRLPFGVTTKINLSV